jgi:hypothetical protein
MDDNIRQAQLTKFSELSSIGLNHGAVARLRDARGMRLRVETGSVWITQQPSEDDVVVHTGEAFRIERDGTTEISALGQRFALVTIEPAIPAAPPKRSFAERLGNFWCNHYVEPMHAPRTYL